MHHRHLKFLETQQKQMPFLYSKPFLSTLNFINCGREGEGGNIGFLNIIMVIEKHSSGDTHLTVKASCYLLVGNFINKPGFNFTYILQCRLRWTYAYSAL